jgi:hypothetical protein
VGLLVQLAAQLEELADLRRLVREVLAVDLDELLQAERRLDLEVGEDRAIVRLERDEATHVAHA